MAAGPVHASGWGQAVFPVPAFEGYTSHFGVRRSADGRLLPHNGLDIAAPLGSPVLSWWGGDIATTINDQTCGIGVVIASGDYEHIYCHLQRPLLQSGQRVGTGQIIGRVGMTGRSSGPHLHWGIRYRGRWLDPVQILKAMIRSHRAQVPAGP